MEVEVSPKSLFGLAQRLSEESRPEGALLMAYLARFSPETTWGEYARHLLSSCPDDTSAVADEELIKVMSNYGLRLRQPRRINWGLLQRFLKLGWIVGYAAWIVYGVIELYRYGESGHAYVIFMVGMFYVAVLLFLYLSPRNK